MKLKQNVRVKGIRPELLIAIIIAQEKFEKAGYELIITSLNDSTHGKNSYHYKGLAVDLRLKHINTEAEKIAIVAAIKESLTSDWDVLYESPGGSNQHCHIELNL